MDFPVSCPSFEVADPISSILMLSGFGRCHQCGRGCTRGIDSVYLVNDDQEHFRVQRNDDNCMCAADSLLA